MCRTHLRAYMESLTRSIEAWERAEWKATGPAKVPMVPPLSDPALSVPAPQQV